ncbi:hypothetical protein [Cryobacterium melibiosiphilum]|uniref:hypothetical protein n=1 Tax=Cryobacterium melibiosiphilum TaxID=995039 RepID=UPI0011C217BE|nr:hypothetical protein [Cryobacterium melibiosiphilum]
MSEKRATWRHWNLAAEAARQLAQLRIASASDREAVIGLVVDAAQVSYLQQFTSRKTIETSSKRSVEQAHALIANGLVTDAGLKSSSDALSS